MSRECQHEWVEQYDRGHRSVYCRRCMGCASTSHLEALIQRDALIELAEAVVATRERWLRHLALRERTDDLESWKDHVEAIRQLGELAGKPWQAKTNHYPHI